MATPLHAVARIARMLRLAGGLAVLFALVAVVLATSGRAAGAQAALELAVPLGGAALLMAAILFFRSRRMRQDQDLP